MNNQLLIQKVKFVARRRNLDTKPDYPLKITNGSNSIKGIFGGICIKIFIDSRKVIIGGKSYVLTQAQFDSLCN